MLRFGVMGRTAKGVREQYEIENALGKPPRAGAGRPCAPAGFNRRLETVTLDVNYSS
jgi:hypothetical protein